ncbi:uncharacterized protein METZ01_LOCUS458130, partial [marine metagenome]
MVNFQPPSMEGNPGNGFYKSVYKLSILHMEGVGILSTSSIGLITKNRVVYGFHVHPKLVSSSCFRMEIHQG